MWEDLNRDLGYVRHTQYWYQVWTASRQGSIRLIEPEVRTSLACLRRSKGTCVSASQPRRSVREDKGKRTGSETTEVGKEVIVIPKVEQGMTQDTRGSSKWSKEWHGTPKDTWYGIRNDVGFSLAPKSWAPDEEAWAEGTWSDLHFNYFPCCLENRPWGVTSRDTNVDVGMLGYSKPELSVTVEAAGSDWVLNPVWNWWVRLTIEGVEQRDAISRMTLKFLVCAVRVEKPFTENSGRRLQ